MLTEDYCNFEVAQLLKEKGFNWNTDKQYYLDKIVGDYNITDRSRNPERYLDAPTLQMAMKWLREVHHIFIDIVSRFSMNADKDVCFSYSCKKLTETYKSSYEYGDGEWLSYEEACEAAIKYCLENLI